MSAELLSELARVKVAFQLRAITAEMGLASVGQSAKRQDAEERLDPKDAHAVPAKQGDAQ
jgi:hypothetical protein